MTTRSHQFRKGNIYRIYFKNFLTYDEIEIYPKPHLNVVLGPNGTGKSSILCGICIGLGGRPEVTGRGKHITEYVKHGKDHAIIEIELHDGAQGKANIRIRREFLRDEKKKNKWYLQDDEVKEIQIAQTVAKMNIHVNNLCQFLPQDRLVEFAKMNKVQLLSSTEKAVGEMKLFEQHEILSQNGRTLKDMNSQLKDLKDRLANEININERLQDQVRNIKLKEDLDKGIEELKTQILFHTYNVKRKTFLEMSIPIKEAEKECSIHASRIEPAKKKLQATEREIRCHADSMAKYDEYCKEADKDMKKLKILWEKKEEEVAIADEEFKSLQQRSQMREKEINDLKMQLQVLNNQLAQFSAVDEVALSQRTKTLNEMISTESQSLLSIQSSYGELKLDMNAINQRKISNERRLLAVQDLRNQRLQVLRARNIQTYNATLWLENNRHLFSSPVHDPMFLAINFTDPAYAKYLENTVSNKDLVAFVCENKYDVKTLKTHADTNGWSVNILHSAPVDPDQYQPSYPFENLRRLGFHFYLKDVVRAPPAIISYLCRNYFIHNVPFGQSVDSEKVPPTITHFFIKGKRYIKKQSRYDGQWSTNISDMLDVIYLARSSNPKEEQQIKRELNQLKEQWNAFLAKIKTLEDSEKEVETNLNKLREEKLRIRTQMDGRKQLQTRINQKMEQLRRREANVIDLGQAEIDKQLKIKKCIHTMKRICSENSEIETRTTSRVLKFQLEELEALKLQQKKRALDRAIETDTELKTTKEKEISQLESDRQEHRLAAQECYKKLVNKIGKDGKISESVGKVYIAKLKDKSLEELQDSLAEKEAHINCIITSDDSVLLEYKKREETIKLLKEEEEHLTQSLNNEAQSVETCRVEWLPQITSLTAKIDHHFADFMSRLDCAGQVELDKGEDENDFSQYGLIIRVKFRDTEKLKELTAHQQSGGERSVSAALYLMALQTLTAVPFRCVDEINQGMDPSNERKMFTMLVQTTTTETASQYFLITPKLLPNLYYNERVNFMNIFNGSSPLKQFRSQKILSHYRKLVRKRASQNHH